MANKYQCKNVHFYLMGGEKNYSLLLKCDSVIHMPVSEVVPFSWSIYNMQSTKADHPYEKKNRNFLMTESFHPYSLLCTISGAHGTWGMEVAAGEGPPRLACCLSLEFLWWLFALDCSDLCQRTRLHMCPSPALLSHLSHHGHTHTIEEKIMR